jgi:hypothetical protein
MRTRLFMTLILGLISLAAFAGEKPSYSDEALSSITEYQGQNGHRIRKVVTSSFQVLRVSLPPDGWDYEVLFKQRIEIVSVESQEGQQGTVSIEAFKKNNGVYSEKLWSIKEPFDTAEVATLGKWDCYHLVKYGCCGAEDTSRYYDIASGRPILTCTGTPVVLGEGTGETARIAAYYSPEASVPPVDVGEWSKYSGMVALYSFEKLLSRALLVSDQFPSLYPISIDLKPRAVILTDSAKRKVVIPISHDKLVVAGAKGNCRIALVEPKSKAK